MLQRPLVIERGKPAHLPMVYVIGKKIFAFAGPATDWQREVCPDSKIETVTIHEAYGIMGNYPLPPNVFVAY